MPISFEEGSVWDTPRDQRIVIPVNCEGVMGAGMAKIYKDKNPRAFRDYQQYCSCKTLRPGGTILVMDDDGRISLLFSTKDSWRDPSRVEWIEQGLKQFRQWYDCLDSYAFPALGCGLGGLQWETVKQMMVDILSPMQNKIYIYSPKNEKLSGSLGNSSRTLSKAGG